MSESTETTPQPTTNSGPEPGSMEDWGAAEPGERRLPPLAPDNSEPEPEPHKPAEPPVEGGDDDAAELAALAEGDAPDAQDEDDDAPDFWSAEDKAWWKSIPPEAKPIIQKYEKQRIEFANKKAEEAAAERKAALEEAKKAASAGEQFAQWLDANGAAFTRAFVDRWSGVDFDKLAEENPAEWARLSQLRTKEHQMLQQAHQQAEAGRAQMAERQQAAEREARLHHHNTLAKELPKEFGTPEAAKKTYETLSKFLVDSGIPAERVAGIYEAPIVKLVKDAYDMRQLRARAKGITNPKPPAQSASTTPTRVVPGARSSANPVNDAARQAVERLKSGEPLSREEAGWAFR